MGPSGQIILGPTGQFTVGPTGQIIVGPSGQIILAYWKSRADTRLDQSQNNKLNRVAYAYVHEIVSNICWLLLYILVKEYIDIWDVELKVRFIYTELWLI